MLIFIIVLAFLALLLFLPLLALVLTQPKIFPYSVQPPKPDNPVFENWQAMMAAEREDWEIQTADGLKLPAWYCKAAEKTDKTVLVANGYLSSRRATAHFGWLFHELGYNVLLPAYHGAKDSNGFFIGFGWTDRADYKLWVDEILRKSDGKAEIALFGISMGASSMLLLSGEELPEAVKTLICDCGYSNLWSELVFRAKQDYHLPAFPFVYLASMWSKILAGYFFKEVDILSALTRNTRPVLFIHGNEDVYVPTKMVYENFAATTAPKKLWIAPHAGHARSYDKNKAAYTALVKDFLLEHFK